ncbi:MAG: SIMPL domain-containing protein, partial [Armatimonadota bacterium]
MSGNCRLIGAILLCAFVAAGSALAQSSDGHGGITVSATATARSRPDIAFVTLGVSTDDSDAAKAAQTNARTTSAVIDALVGAGIQRADIETVQYSVSPITNYQTNPPSVSGYRVSNIVRVKLKDLAKIASVIDTAAKAGSNEVQGVRFELEDGTKLRHQALVEALKKAEADARLMARTLGVGLGKAISASQTAPIVPSPL